MPMHARLLSFLALLLLPLASLHAADAKGLPAIDIDRYAGTWHEIARMPHFFQRHCHRDTTATYTRQADHVKVVNRCVKADGEVISAEGKAFVTDAPVNRKLKVGFLEILGWMPFKGDYWILDIEPDYRWVIVGGPDREYAWILSRTPTLDDATRAHIDARLRALGYDPKALSGGAAPGR